MMNKWNINEISTLKRMKATGKTYSHIGKVLGRSRGSVASKSISLGLSNKTVRSIEISTITNKKGAKKKTTQDLRNLKSLIDDMPNLNNSTCRFPKTRKFCKKKRTHGSYCTEHAKLCYAGKIRIKGNG